MADRIWLTFGEFDGLPSDGISIQALVASPCEERSMDGMAVALFVLATFVGGFVSGFSGFAMGLVVSGVWLHIITPIQTAMLIAGYGLLTQSYGIWKLRHALRWKDIWPLTLGSTIGIPIGV